MAVLVVPIEITPYRLRYSVSRDDTAAGTTTVLITNSGNDPGVGNGDLRWDARFYRNFPIWNLFNWSIPLLSQAEAQELLFGDSLLTAPAIEKIRSHIYVTPLFSSTFGEWSVEAQEGSAVGAATSANHAVLQVFVPQRSATEGSEAYIDIDFAHTFDR